MERAAGRGPGRAATPGAQGGRCAPRALQAGGCTSAQRLARSVAMAAHRCPCAVAWTRARTDLALGETARSRADEAGLGLECCGEGDRDEPVAGGRRPEPPAPAIPGRELRARGGARYCHGSGRRGECAGAEGVNRKRDPGPGRACSESAATVKSWIASPVASSPPSHAVFLNLLGDPRLL